MIECKTVVAAPAGVIFAIALLVAGSTARGEYADVVLNRLSDAAGVRPVIFPHWFHRIRYQCRVCHGELAIRMSAGANAITMDAIAAGRYCGACHNGDLAWAADKCDLCHSARPGIATGVRGGHQTMGPGRW